MTDMRISEAGLEFIASEESWIPTPYRDFAGVWTIGYGHAIKSGEHFTSLTKDEGLALFRRDIASFERAVNVAVNVPLEQCQFDALVSLAFNIGGARFATSTVAAKLAAGDYRGAADAMLLFNKAKINGVLQASATLTIRRERERAMFLGLPDLTSTLGVQQALADLGYLPPAWVDGKPGPATSAAVRAFQKRAGLKADGVVGSRTRFALQAALDQKSLQDPPAA